MPRGSVLREIAKKQAPWRRLQLRVEVNGNTIILDVEAGNTINNVKAKLQHYDISGQLVFAGQQLADDHTLELQHQAQRHDTPDAGR